ncbi:multidrug resistance-associated ABC transporter [Ceratobasidium sp. AG-Ba]|nr:multidrug resistance-associated ABC transporter [Ceratobasidium sp. AG-Ba]
MAQGWPSWVCRPDDETGTYPRWNKAFAHDYPPEPPGFGMLLAPRISETSVCGKRISSPLRLFSFSVFCSIISPLSSFPALALAPNFPPLPCSILRPFLTLEEAETIEYDSVSYANGHVDSDVVAKHAGPPVWKTTILVGVALFETAMWTAYGCYVLFLHSNTWPDVWAALVILLGASTWVYAAVRPVVRRKVATPTYDLYLWYVLHSRCRRFDWCTSV